jgi:hypothetical protein
MTKVNLEPRYVDQLILKSVHHRLPFTCDAAAGPLFNISHKAYKK